jgi:hypothetical protein
LCPNSTLVSSISVKYPPWHRFSPEPYHYDLICDFVYHIVQSIQEMVTYDLADGYFSLDVLTPMEAVSLSIGTWDSSSPPRVSDEVVRPRGLSDERNMTGLCNVLCHPPRKEKLHGRL